MAIYSLIEIASNEVINIIDWDPTSSYSPPEGYSLELYTTESYFFGNEPTSSFEYEETLGGHLYGKFTGELTGSITLGGKTFDYLFNQTEFGSLLLQNDAITPNNSCFTIDDDVNTTKVLLSVKNYETDKQNKYEDILQHVISNNITNYLLTVKDHLGLYERRYLVNDTTDNTDHVELDVELVYSNGNQHGHFHDSLWYINFNLPDEVYVGKFIGEHTGSFFGAFKGLLDGTASNSIYAQTASFTDNASTIEVIVKSKNWTKPSWAKTIRVTCVGGGGGGGAALATEDSGPVTGGGGGGGGTITTGEFDADTLPNVINITIGAGGLGGTHDSVSLIGASNGGDSYFGRYLIARGGNAGFTGGNQILFTYGGSSIANIHYLNTGAGGGGAGTVDGYIGSPLFISDASMAPPLPMPTKYLNGLPSTSYYSVFPTPIPAVIAPTGGGGGLGYDVDKGGRQDGITEGGHISGYGLTNANNRFQSLSPWEYSSGSSVWFGGQLIDTGHYPAFNTEVGLGGRGGNPYTLEGPTEGTSFGGGGGGAFGGGIDGRYINGEINGTPYNFGANGARGVVVIISEA